MVDDKTPDILGIEYNDRNDFKDQNDIQVKDYYGLGEKIIMDVVFNEPVFVNDFC